MVDLSQAVACKIITPAEAIAIERGIKTHPGGATEFDLRQLTADEFAALKRLTDWMAHSEDCGK